MRTQGQKSLTKASLPALGDPAVQWLLGSLLSVVRSPELEADHLFTFSGEVMNYWNYSSTSYAFMACIATAVFAYTMVNCMLLVPNCRIFGYIVTELVCSWAKLGTSFVNVCLVYVNSVCVIIVITFYLCVFGCYQQSRDANKT